MKVYGIIMAGGDGTRCWPLSRKATPKQLLNLSGNDVLINETIDRLMPAVTHEIFVVTNTLQFENLKKAVHGRVPSGHIFVEPTARNTAACIGFAAIEIIKKYGDGIMVIAPSDSYIKDNAEYARILNLAVDCAKKTEKLVTVGITPTFPATGYGYIECGASESPAKPVLRFVEKPDKERAKEYLKSGDYVWNSGVFIWKASVILQKYKELLPDVYESLLKISAAIGTPDEKRVLDEVYRDIRSISVDYGILEKTGDILVVPGEFGWSDVGSLDMLNVLRAYDENENIISGNVVALDTNRSILYSQNKLIATVGLENIIVVDTPDVTLVCPKDRAQDVKKIVEELKKRGQEEVL